MDVEGWRIWYTDGRVFSSDSVNWGDLPADGVLVVIVYYDEGDRKHFDHCEWYFHEPGTELFGTTDNLEEAYLRYPDASFKRGRWTDLETFQTVRRAAWDSESP